MAQVADTSGMEIALILFIVVIGPLALAFGADSRLDENAYRRRYRSMV
jgi:hypothetical protein